MTDQWTERLSEYLDDDLTDWERRDLAVHLETCEDCRAILMELRAVAAKAAALPDRLPEADLWPAVRAGIGARQVVSLESKRKERRRLSFSIPQLVAAAAVLMMVSTGGAWLALSGSAPADLATGEPEELQPVPVVFDPYGRADSAITQLERILAVESGRLDTSTVRILTQNLALIDRAINQARKALESDPGNAYLNDHLARTMRKKIEVLRRAADLTAVAS